MRYITGLGIAVLALLIGGPWLAANAEGPSGSYRQTCKHIGVRGSTLYATCKDMNNEWRSTQLPDYQRCRGEIQNLNGNLACTSSGGNGRYHDRDQGNYGNGGYYGGAPRDTYRQTCHDVHTDGNTLKATCQKVDGGWRDTSLKNFNRCQRIVNEDGHLRCM